MRVEELPLVPFYAGSVALGAASGALAAVLADVLPRRYGITLLVTGSPRTKRNVMVVALATACAIGLAARVAAHPSLEARTAAWYLAVSIVLSALAIGSAAIDLEHMILPDEITYGGALLGLVTSPFRYGLASSAIGAVVAVAVTWLPHLVFRLVRKKAGQGLGDVKLVLMAGAWQGPLGAVFVTFAGALQSAIAAVVMNALHLTYAVPASVSAEIDELRAKAAAGDEEAKQALADDPMAAEPGEGVLATRLPLGPFLALACVELLFTRDVVSSLVDRFFSGP
ncbi:MAG TPA: A24 family peptidase [Labilithrix sp.]